MALEQSKERVVRNQVAANKLSPSASGGNDGRGEGISSGEKGRRNSLTRTLIGYEVLQSGFWTQRVKLALFPFSSVCSRARQKENFSSACSKRPASLMITASALISSTSNLRSICMTKLLSVFKAIPQLTNLFIGSQLRTSCLVTPRAKIGLFPGHNTASGNMSRAKGAPSLWGLLTKALHLQISAFGVARAIPGWSTPGFKMVELKAKFPMAWS